MIAIDTASKNVKSLSEKLSLEYNRKRQFKIMSDLIDTYCFWKASYN